MNQFTKIFLLAAVLLVCEHVQAVRVQAKDHKSIVFVLSHNQEPHVAILLCDSSKLPQCGINPWTPILFEDKLHNCWFTDLNIPFQQWEKHKPPQQAKHLKESEFQFTYKINKKKKSYKDIMINIEDGYTYKYSVITFFLIETMYDVEEYEKIANKLGTELETYDDQEKNKKKHYGNSANCVSYLIHFLQSLSAVDKKQQFTLAKPLDSVLDRAVKQFPFTKLTDECKNIIQKLYPSNM